MNDPRLAAVLEALRNMSGDIQDRRRAPTVGPNFPLEEDGSGRTPFENFILGLIQQEARNIPYRDKPPTYFPAGTDLGRLQRAFGAYPGPPHRRLR